VRWEFIVALVVAIPIILFPVAFLWYLNSGGIYSAIQKARDRKAVHKQKAEVITPENISRPRIHKVQVFHKAGEREIAEPMDSEASPSKEEDNRQED